MYPLSIFNRIVNFIIHDKMYNVHAEISLENIKIAFRSIAGVY